MTIILGSYTDFENRLLVAAYFTSNRLDRDIVTLNEITEVYVVDLPQRYTIRALSEYWANGLTLAKPHLSGIGTQSIGLTAAGLRAAEKLIESNAVKLENRENRKANFPSGTVGALTDGELTRLLEQLANAETQIEIADLSNTERAQARAYIVAIRALAEAPEPPRDLIWEIVSRANNIAGIASLFVSIAGLFA